MASRAASVPGSLGRVRVSSLVLPQNGPVTTAQVGVDLVEIAKVRRVFQDRPALLASVFTEEELRYCRTRRPPYPHLAARFAAKEAALKALGTGAAARVSWTDVEVTKELSGAPGLVLRGGAQEIARSQGIVTAALSLSHSARYAIAVILLVNAGRAR